MAITTNLPVRATYDKIGNLTTLEQGSTVTILKGGKTSREFSGSQFLLDGQAVVPGDPRILSIKQKTTNLDQLGLQNALTGRVTQAAPSGQKDLPSGFCFLAGSQASERPTGPSSSPTESTLKKGPSIENETDQKSQSMPSSQTRGPFTDEYRTMLIDRYTVLFNIETGETYKIRGTSRTFLKGHLTVNGSPIDGIMDPRIERAPEYAEYLRFTK